MPSPQNLIDPSHQSKQALLRMLGPALIVLGLILIAVGTVRMFSPAWGENSDPTAGFLEGRKTFDDVHHDMDREFHAGARSSFGGFALAAVGMVCLAAGATMTKYGYMGSVARYAAEELAPVGADTVNYLGKNTQEGVRSVAEAISERGGGERQAGPEVRALRCPDCHALNEVGAKFCNQCGRAIGTQGE